ncbi:hypothetical protein CK203_061030 [Vitis vinifera]|uniref:Uncharacterized protein n=1 Tax=Vitis vinifera TaxID=29760 RepID=A0A438GH04_VITVI|nr:hypothetical protein CK203_061030 [Vitis vinifera]
MEDDDFLPTTALTTNAKKDSSDASLFGKGQYKFWVLAAILLLTFWSMFTGTVTLRWSASNLNHISDDFDSHIHDDLDVLEMEEREGGEAHVGCVHQQPTGRLPRFWQEAFEAAYEDLANDDPDVRLDFFHAKSVQTEEFED